MVISDWAGMFLIALISWSLFSAFQTNSATGTQEWLNREILRNNPLSLLDPDWPKAKLLVLQIPSIVFSSCSATFESCKLKKSRFWSLDISLRALSSKSLFSLPSCKWLNWTVHQNSLLSKYLKVYRITWEHGVSDPPRQDDQRALGYDEFSWTDVPTGHGTAALSW